MAPKATVPRKLPKATMAAAANLPSAPAPSADKEPAMAQRLSFLVHTISGHIAMLGNRHFREHGLNHFSARILVLLLENEELRTGELVDLMVLPQSTISSQLQALHKRRLISRKRSRQDNRSVIVSLTLAGAELARDCNALSLRVQELLLRDVPEREKQIAFAFLHKMEKRLAVLEKHNIVPFHEPLELQVLAGLDSVARPVKPRGNGRALAA